MNGGHDKNRNRRNDSCDGRRTRLAWLSNTVHVFKAMPQAMNTEATPALNMSKTSKSSVLTLLAGLK